jgi:hypothetical protein
MRETSAANVYARTIVSKPLCLRSTPSGPCILERNHATPREVYAPCSIESYGEGSAIEQFGCFGVPDSDDEIAEFVLGGKNE